VRQVLKWGSLGVAPHILLTSELERGEWTVSRPRAITPEKGPTSTHYVEGRVGLRSGLDAVMMAEISFSHLESNPRFQDYLARNIVTIPTESIRSPLQDV
jgi:hypothetical protein